MYTYDERAQTSKFIVMVGSSVVCMSVLMGGDEVGVTVSLPRSVVVVQ